MMAIGAVSLAGLLITTWFLVQAGRTVRWIWQQIDPPAVRPTLRLIARPLCGARHGPCRCGLPVGHDAPHECDALHCEERTWPA